MKMVLWCFIDPINGKSWNDTSSDVTQTLERGPYFARKLREWTRAYIEDRSIPENQYGTWAESLVDNENLRQELNMYLQSIGKYVTAIHLVQYMVHDDMKTHWKLKWDGISHAMAVWWMGKFSYRWTFQPSGQFVNSHEREDIVNYQQNIFLPAMAEYNAKIR
jgi:hypothetical protein